MLTRKKITEIRNLHSDGYSMRKIAKRLNISKDTALKYIKSTPSSEEILPTLNIGTTEVPRDVKTNSKYRERVSIIRDEPIGGIAFQGMPISEFPNTHYPIPNSSYNQDDYTSITRGIRFSQPYSEPDYYPKDLNYYEKNFDS